MKKSVEAEELITKNAAFPVASYDDFLTALIYLNEQKRSNASQISKQYVAERMGGTEI